LYIVENPHDSSAKQKIIDTSFFIFIILQQY